MNITADLLVRAIGCTPHKGEQWAMPLSLACERYEINTPARLAAFLAQIGHESGKLQWTRELWGPTGPQSRYDGRDDLGNAEPGDGYRYRGRGLIQITGRAGYRAASDALGHDFVVDPDALERAPWAAISAAWWWHAHGCNELADAGEFDRITRTINGGTNGADNRRRLWVRAKAALGVA